jgi:hypothetical protein
MVIHTVVMKTRLNDASITAIKAASKTMRYCFNLVRVEHLG